MPSMKNTWAVAMSSTRARILRGLQSSDEGRLPELVLRSEAHHLRLALMGGEWPLAALPRRHRAKPALGHIMSDDMSFYRLTSTVLDIHRRAGDFKRLALVAPARVIADMTDVMSSPLREMLVVREVLHAVEADEDELIRVFRRCLTEAGHVP